MAFALVTPFCMFFLINLQASSARISPQVPCFFIFGDSLVDNGNNNQLQTEAKANYPPYGIDFPEGPTGRFTNGRNQADFLATLLGFDTYIRPFSMAQGNDIIRGVNYASGSAGIGETGQQLGDRISLDRQLQNHNLTISRITRLLGNRTSAEEHLSKCLYYFVVGSNDYVNNYNIPEYYPISSVYTPEEYATALIHQYSQQLTVTKISYDSLTTGTETSQFWGRKIAVSGLALLGCVPQELGRARGTNGSPCVDSINNAVRLFNDKLEILVDELNDKLTDSKFIYVAALDLRPQALFALGIRLVSRPCCKASNFTGQCVPGVTPCPVRVLSAFYDNFHPTEIVNMFLANAVYTYILKLIS